MTQTLYIEGEGPQIDALKRSLEQRGDLAGFNFGLYTAGSMLAEVLARGQIIKEKSDEAAQKHLDLISVAEQAASEVSKNAELHKRISDLQSQVEALREQLIKCQRGA